MSAGEPLLRPFERALAASDEGGSMAALAAALKGGVAPAKLERSILRAMAADGEQLHSMLYASAAFDIASALGPQAGKYPLAAAAVQIARQPKNSHVAELVTKARAKVGAGTRSTGEVERALAEALDRFDLGRAVDAAVDLHHLGRESSFVLNLFAKWAARPEVVVKPEGYVTHLPVQTAAALNLVRYLATDEDVDLLLGHLAFCQVELARSYRTRRVEPRRTETTDPSEALLALTEAIRAGSLPEIGPLIRASSVGAQGLEETGRAIMRCALEEEGGLGHRFVLADSARRIARQLHPAVGRAALHNAALSIAHGYRGPKRLLEARDLPHPYPGGSDFPGRLLVGLTSGNLAEAHAALRGFFEAGTSARQVALCFLDAASHIDATKLTSDHPLILTQAAWRAIADGSFAGQAVPLLAELAAKLAAAPKDHALIQAVEEAWADAPGAAA